MKRIIICKKELGTSDEGSAVPLASFECIPTELSPIVYHSSLFLVKAAQQLQAVQNSVAWSCLLQGAHTQSVIVPLTRVHCCVVQGEPEQSFKKLLDKSTGCSRELHPVSFQVQLKTEISGFDLESSLVWWNDCR